MIHQCLGDFVKGRTVFLITHSVTPQILEFATRIVVMEQGRLLATGSHDDLLQACSAYQRLYNAQSSSRGGDSMAEFQLPPAQAEAINPTASHSEEPQLIKFAKASETADDKSLAKNQRRKLS
jgi:ABC-type multidrug transport system ATPase subunit